MKVFLLATLIPLHCCPGRTVGPDGIVRKKGGIFVNCTHAVLFEPMKGQRDRLEVFRIGPYEVRPEQNVISGPDRDVRVEPKAMLVLSELAGAEGRTVARETLIEAVWPRGFVTDDVLTRCIVQLRRALGDDARSPLYLETIPKQGYRLKQPADRASAADQLPPASPQEHGALVILPFQNLSGRDEDTHIADGLTELLICRLAGLLRTRVISRTTSMQFRETRKTAPEISAQLGADWIVEGSVLMSGDQIQVVVQLIDGPEDAHTWTESYMREFTDLLVLQNEIAINVAREVQRETGDPGTWPGARHLSPESLRVYLKGRHLLSQRNAESLRNADACFLRVNETEPRFSDGWGSRAEALMLLMHYGAEPVDGTLDGIRELLLRALDLNPESAIALSCRGGIKLFFHRDLEGAESDLKRSLHSLPNYCVALLALANICSIRGDKAGAMRWLQRALEVDPLDVGINMNLGDHLILHRQYDEAIDQLRKTLELSQHHLPTRLRLAWALALAGSCRAAETELAAARQQAGDNAYILEYAALVAGSCNGKTAREHLQSLKVLANKAFVPSWALARAAAAAGDHAFAVEQLNLAIREGSSSLMFYGVTPAFDDLRRKSEGRAIAQALCLPVL